MKKLSHEEISYKRASIEKLDNIKRMPVYVLLNSIRSCYNVGSIFRTSDGAMIEKLFLCGYTPTPEKKEVIKTALGSQNSVNWEYIKDPIKVIASLKSNGIKVCALELTDKSISYCDVSKSDFPLCLIVGNEISGVSQELIELCDFSIEIPQFGIKQSLNVAVAYGVAVFDLRRVYETK
jgi:tRNA G18 (ribose-2'-O)-methylase SpoU